MTKLWSEARTYLLATELGVSPGGFNVKRKFVCEQRSVRRVDHDPLAAAPRAAPRAQRAAQSVGRRRATVQRRATTCDELREAVRVRTVDANAKRAHDVARQRVKAQLSPLRRFSAHAHLLSHWHLSCVKT